MGLFNREQDFDACGGKDGARQRGRVEMATCVPGWHCEGQDRAWEGSTYGVLGDGFGKRYGSVRSLLG